MHTQICHMGLRLLMQLRLKGSPFKICRLDVLLRPPLQMLPMFLQLMLTMLLMLVMFLL